MLRTSLEITPLSHQEQLQEEEEERHSVISIVPDHAKSHAPVSRCGSNLSGQSNHSTGSSKSGMDRWQPAPIPPPPSLVVEPKSRWESGPSPQLGNLRKSSSSISRAEPTAARAITPPPASLDTPKLPQRTLSSSSHSNRSGTDRSVLALVEPCKRSRTDVPQLPKRCLSNDLVVDSDCPLLSGKTSPTRRRRPMRKPTVDSRGTPAAA